MLMLDTLVRIFLRIRQGVCMKTNLKILNISTIKSLFQKLPKQCSCSGCKSLKELMLGEIGNKKYQQYIKEYQIACTK